MATNITKAKFGEFKGKAVYLYTLNNGSASAEVITYGATLTSLRVPDRSGSSADVVTGFDTLDGFLEDNKYFGATVGRVANRISNGSFTIDGTKYQLDQNNGTNSLHGGNKSLDKVVWDSYVGESDGSLHLSYMSPDGESHYPGNLVVNVTYSLTKDNSLVIHYRALTDRPTPVSLTNHAYFNLGGHDAGPQELYKHKVRLNADNYTPVSYPLKSGDGPTPVTPTGEIKSVAGTQYDLRVADVFLEEKIRSLESSGHLGFDMNFCINQTQASEELAFTARVEHPKSGRVLEVWSNQPGVHFYTSDYLPTDDSMVGKGGAVYHKHGAFCLETQNYPDAVNKPAFPNAILTPGNVYDTTTKFSFSVMN